MNSFVSTVLGRVVITIFPAMQWPHQPFYVFWDADSMTLDLNFETRFEISLSFAAYMTVFFI